MLQRTLRRLKAIPPVDGLPSKINAPQPPPKFKPGRFISKNPAAYTDHGLPDFRPSETARMFSAKHNIQFPSALRILKGQNSKDFPLRVFVSSQHTFSHYHLRYLDQYEHALTDKILHQYAEKKQEQSLWCYVQGLSTTDDSPVVVRHASERMVRAALFRALNAAGYDSVGKSQDGTKKGLRGTIRVSVLQPKATLKIEFDRLIDYMTKLLAVAMPQLDGGESFKPRR